MICLFLLPNHNNLQPINFHEEQLLFQRIAKGDEEAFATIFHDYTSRLFLIVVKLLKSESDAEEVIQNVFLKLWLQRENLPQIQNPGAWLNRLASNEALDFLRRKATRHKYLRTVDKAEANDDELHHALDAKELNRLIWEAVEKLPPARQEIFRLSRQEGKSRDEIAEQLGLSKHTVKNQMASALKFIQVYIEKNGGTYLPVVLFFPLFEKIFPS